MPDNDIDPKLLEELKAHDERIRHIDEGLAIEQEIQSNQPINPETSPIWKLVFERLGREASEALEELATVNPSDTKAIFDLQAKVYRARALERFLEEVVLRGQRAQAEMIQEANISVAEPVNDDGG